LGQEIEHSHFRKQDFLEFEAHLHEETQLLDDYFQQNRFESGHPVAGFELEAWLIDREGQPLPANDRFLDVLDSDLVTPELALFNVELNCTPRSIQGRSLSKMQSELEKTWKKCQTAANKIDASLVTIGILPTIREQALILDNMSAMTRYRALNEGVRRLRKGDLIKLDIVGREKLKTWHEDVMLESAATSFQVHMQIPPTLAARTYNAAAILSAPMIAISANSPFMFGHDLWDETRIPVFEQAVSVSTTKDNSDARVTFGHNYVKESLLECFTENIERYPILLPEPLDPDPSHFSHLQLHNGTIWRWNRPLIGFDNKGKPHLRIEHRALPSGPTHVDMIANAALFYGMVQRFSHCSTPPETRLPFVHALDNFYQCARDGLRSDLRWFDGAHVNVRVLLTEKLIPTARRGLDELGVAHEDIEFYMGIIEQRLKSGQTGCAWQRAWAEKHGRDMKELTLAYRDNQTHGQPVHEWTL